MFRYSFTLCVLFLSLSCSSDALNVPLVLSDAIAENETVYDNVIACAASNESDDLISVFFYPREGASNIHCYETLDVSFEKNDYEHYNLVEAPIQDVFNGYMKKFEIEAAVEKWVIVSYDEGGKTHLSTPIRLKQLTKPTVYISENVSIDTATTMPKFSWIDGGYNDTDIYFQVVSDASDNLFSGTYTNEKFFQYYNLDNVVLNITKDTPPALVKDQTYNFTLMAVSVDNWVNFLSEVPFSVEEE